MKELKGSQRKFLRGLAHKLNPSAYIGQKGLATQLLEEIDMALNASELIKVKFNDFKEKEQKSQLSEEICKQLGCQMAGMIGHVIILYRQQQDKEKRRIKLPD